MLRTLGFERRQAAGAVAWQATTFAVVGVVTGVPFGVMVAHWTWSLVADDMGIDARPVVPLAVIAGVAAAVVVLLERGGGRAGGHGPPAEARRDPEERVMPLFAHLRAELRRRWPAWVAVVVLIGVTGGLVLGALAGARRTATAFPRMVDRTETADVMVNPNMGSNSALDVDELAALPGVRRVGVVDGVGATLIGADGEPDQMPLTLAQRDPGVLVDFERPRILSGTLFDPADPEQVMITDDVAERHGLAVGDPVQIATLDMDQLDAWMAAGEHGDQPSTVHQLTVAAVVVSPDSVVDDEAYAFGEVLLTRAFAEQQHLQPFYYGVEVDLAGGADAVPAFRQAVQKLVPGEAFEFQTLGATSDRVQRSTRPHVVAVLAFAVLVGLAALVVCGQGVARLSLSLSRDADSLRAIGVPRRRLRRAAVGRAAAVVGLGTAAAVVVAVALSPLFPLGVARRAEMSPGVAFDALVLVPGALALFLLLVSWSAFSARRLGSTTPRRPVRSVGVLEGMGRRSGSPVLSTGIRAAVARPGGGATASTRAALAGLAVAIGAMVAATTFGANLAHFVSTPSEYGWTWSALVSPPDAGRGRDEIVDRLRSAPQFAGTTLLTVDEVHLDGQRLPAIGTETGGDGPSLTIVAGHAPQAPDEIALGRRTMTLLGVGLGDTVTAGDGGASLQVVGQAVFPGLGTYNGADRTELGKGALLEKDTLARLGEGFGFEWVAVDAPDRAALDAGMARVTAGYDAAVQEGQLEVLEDPQRPSDVRGMQRVELTPMVVAAVLLTLAGVAFAFVLAADVRRRRRELAVLKTFGFRNRQVLGSVACQASVTAGLAVLIGVPAGVVVGRLTWSALANEIGVAIDARTPFAYLGLSVVVVAVVANVVAVVPGLLAARVRPAPVLRSE